MSLGSIVRTVAKRAPMSRRSIMSATAAEAQVFVDTFNQDYEAKHEAFEKQFWGTKMNLASTSETVYSAENLSKTKAEMENLLSDPETRQQAEHLRRSLPEEAPADLKKTLDIIIRTCHCYDMSSAPEAKKLREETGVLESQLEMARNQMKLGYTASDGSFHAQSSVGLRNLMRTSADEAVRKAAYEGLRSIGPFVLGHGFVEIIKLRNKVAKNLGFIDYYGEFQGCLPIVYYAMQGTDDRWSCPQTTKYRMQRVLEKSSFLRY
jgi:Angiotensin-converting enzyme